ncbi:MAG TPA: (d)CMP kinase, partial [Holophagaceae bacterium]|nr:(d)CMP kinase [Holophagaceae bacterium]
RRRFLELQAKGLPAVEAEVARDLAARDHADTTRAVAPLKKAEGAWELDSSDLNLEEVVEAIVAHHHAHA